MTARLKFRLWIAAAPCALAADIVARASDRLARTWQLNVAKSSRTAPQ